MEKFENFSDEDLITLSRSGNSVAEEELICRYTAYVRSFSRPYFLAGGDSEDLIQECMIGLVKAIREFDSGRDASFRTFASSCIRNKLYSAIKNASRNKHSPLNNSVSLELPLFERSEESISLLQHDLGVSADPVERIIGNEAFRELSQTIYGLLSRFESEVFTLYLAGLSYEEISEKTSKPQKSIDNAVQRIRRKFARHISIQGNIR